MRSNFQQIVSYCLGLLTQNPGLREVDLEASPKRGSIYYESHVTQFAYNLVFQAPFLEKRLVDNNVTIDEIIYMSLIEPNAFLRSINAEKKEISSIYKALQVP